MYEETLILKSLALNLPILLGWGLGFPRVITLVVPPGFASVMANYLRNFDNSKINNHNSEFNFFMQVDAKKAQTIEQEFCAGQLDKNRAIKGLPVIITDNPFIEEFSRRQFYIFFEEPPTAEIDLNVVLPSVDMLPSIRARVEEYKGKADSMEELCLVAATYFVQACMLTSSSLESVFDTAIQLCIRDEEARDSSDVSNAFSEYLYSWQKNNRFVNVFELGKLGCHDFENSIFYDSNFLYLSSALFKRIVSPLTKTLPINALKGRLVKSGVLIADKSDTFTTKVSFMDENGNAQRKRVIKIRQDKINKVGSTGFLDRCLLLREVCKNV